MSELLNCRAPIALKSILMIDLLSLHQVNLNCRLDSITFVIHHLSFILKEMKAMFMARPPVEFKKPIESR